ncbi:MAG: AraC family transcriptional regulator [Pseudomonadota bacterium]
MASTLSIAQGTAYPVASDWYRMFDTSTTLIETQSLDEARALIGEKISPHDIDILDHGQDLNVRYNGVSNGAFAMLNARMGADVRIKPREAKSFYYAYTPLKGRARVYSREDELDLNEFQTMIVSPENAYQIDVAGQSDRLVIGLEASSFHAYLEMLMLRSLSRPLIFDMRGANQTTSQVWQSFVASIGAALFSTTDTVSRARVMKTFSEATMAMALELFPHNYRDELRNQKMDFDTKRLNVALDYIHANLRRTTTLRDISQACGMSGRNLQLLFKKRCGQSPMDYFKSQKFAMIHDALENASPGTRVTDILDRFDVVASGYFSAQYKQRFGCTPSQSIGRSRLLA